MRLAVCALALLACANTAAAHEGTGSHEGISGRIEPKGAWSWTVDEPVGMSYFIDESKGRQGALRILAEDGPARTHTVRILPGEPQVRLEPQDLSVRMGDKVTWINEDNVAHTLVGTAGVYREPAPQPGKGVPAPAGALFVVAAAAWLRRL